MSEAERGGLDGRGRSVRKKGTELAMRMAVCPSVRLSVRPRPGATETSDARTDGRTDGRKGTFSITRRAVGGEKNGVGEEGRATGGMAGRKWHSLALTTQKAS